MKRMKRNDPHDMTDMIAGVLQWDILSGDIDANLSLLSRGLSRLSEKNAHLALLPEMWAGGFGPLSMIREQAQKMPQIISALSGLAKKHQMIIAGTLAEASGERIYNTLVVINQDGSVAGQYQKIHLFAYTGEDEIFSAGNQAVVCKTSAGPMGLMICYDLRFPELCRSLALAGARMVLISAQWPQTRIHHWDTLLKARAIENQIFIAAANRVGTDGDLLFNGHSQIVSPDGKTLACITDQATETAAHIDFTEIDVLKNRFDYLNQRVPSAYIQ